MPNLFAYVVLWVWPLAVYLLFRRLPREVALICSILGGYLLLPTRTGLDLPGLPTIDKDGMPVLAAALMVLLGVGAAARGMAQGSPPPRPATERGALWYRLVLGVTLFVSPLATVLGNAEPVVFGPLVLPAMRLYDAASLCAFTLIMVLPYMLARRFLYTAESHALLLKALALGLLVYSLPILYEIRMSPQLNILIYGFFPHEFGQHIRPGGYRPLVFLEHGLWLAILVAMAILASATLWRLRLAEGRRAGQWLLAGIGLLVVLVLSNSLGALVIAVLLLPLVLLVAPRVQLLAAGAIAAVVLFYPMVRSTGLIPADTVVRWAAQVNAERADSLLFRLENEDALSARAAEKPLAGWGTWGRNLLYDPYTGQQTSITDGAWIIVIGTAGWLGYLSQFGLLTLPILLLALRRNRIPTGPATAGLALVLAANLVDLVPNATLTPVTWLLAGALAGRHAFGQVGEKASPSPPEARPPRSWSLVTEGQGPRATRAPLADAEGATLPRGPKRRNPRDAG